MATTLIPGNSYFNLSYAAASARLDTFSWFTSANLTAVYAIAPNRQGYVSVLPGSNLSFAPFTTLDPGTVYVLRTVASFSVDSSLITAPGSPPQNYTDVFTAPASPNLTPTLFQAVLDGRFSYSQAVVTTGNAVVDFQLAGGGFLSAADFNTATAGLSDAQVQAATIAYTVRITPTNTSAVNAEITRTPIMPRTYFRAQTTGFTALNGSTGTATIDASSGQGQNNHTLDLTMNTTLVISNPTNGAEGELWVNQPSQPYTLTLPAGLGSGVITPQLGGVMVIGWAYNGSTFSFIRVQQ